MVAHRSEASLSLAKLLQNGIHATVCLKFGNMINTNTKHIQGSFPDKAANIADISFMISGASLGKYSPAIFGTRHSRASLASSQWEDPMMTSASHGHHENLAADEAGPPTRPIWKSSEQHTMAEHLTSSSGYPCKFPLTASNCENDTQK